MCVYYCGLKFLMKKLTVDAVDEKLPCMKLRCQRALSEEGRLTAGSKFGSTSMKCILGLLHVVPRDKFFFQNISCFQRKSLEDLGETCLGWKGKDVRLRGSTILVQT